jgi:hypothetical protein
VLWPTTLRLSLDYYESLTRYAVPLDERAVAALAHSAMALDMYCWMAQRLHRIPPGKPQFVPWTALQEQFGQRGSQASIDRSSSIPRSSAKRAKSAIEASTMRFALETTQVRRRKRASQWRWREWSRSMPCVSSLPTNSRPCGISSA